jgi:hypothetical protein
MALELYLSRGLVFRVTVPRGKQGHFLEMMERKKNFASARRQFINKRGSLGNGNDARSQANKRPSYTTVSHVLPVFYLVL